MRLRHLPAADERALLNRAALHAAGDRPGTSGASTRAGSYVQLSRRTGTVADENTGQTDFYVMRTQKVDGVLPGDAVAPADSAAAIVDLLTTSGPALGALFEKLELATGARVSGAWTLQAEVLRKVFLARCAVIF